jgi:hypothetical protein
MTGRDLIIYILEHNLEDEEVLKNGIFVGFISEDELAVKFEVGVSTIRAWHALDMIEGVNLNGTLYFLNGVTDPRKSY